MSYVNENLMSGETVVYRTRLHWIVFLAPLVVLLSFILIGLGMPYRSGTPSSSNLLMWLGLVGVLALLASLVLFLSSEFAVTNKRVIIKVGFLHRRSMEILLTKVEAISVDQPLLGRFLDYGNLTVGGSGGTKEIFEKIWSPLEFRRRVQEQAALQG